VIALTVNGVERQAAASPDTSLLLVLRNDLDLKGARFGCGQGSCGACVVQVDGRAAFSCNTPLWAVAGREVTTIESLHGNPHHPLIAAFLEHDVGQCGYCLAGVVMAAKALLERQPDADRAAIVAALGRHLCRCGAHTRILRAIEDARDRMRA